MGVQRGEGRAQPGQRPAHLRQHAPVPHRPVGQQDVEGVAGPAGAGLRPLGHERDGAARSLGELEHGGQPWDHVPQSAQEFALRDQ